MATPHEKIAESLDALKALQNEGRVSIRSFDLSRTHKERLQKNGFIQKVIKDWYIPANPADKISDSTIWYTSFWPFCSQYLVYVTHLKHILIILILMMKK